MNLYNNCISLLEANGKQVFERSLIIKLTPHTPPLLIREVFANDGVLFITDKAGNTQRIEPEGSETIPNSIYQRLKILGLNET